MRDWRYERFSESEQIIMKILKLVALVIWFAVGFVVIMVFALVVRPDIDPENKFIPVFAYFSCLGFAWYMSYIKPIFYSREEYESGRRKVWFDAPTKIIYMDPQSHNIVTDTDIEPEQEDKTKDINIEKTYHNVMQHILLYGNAGLGKSALAKVVSKEAANYYNHETKFIKLSPSQLKSKKQLDEVMLNVLDNPYCFLFIDEIHGMQRDIEESLYSAIQDGEYDMTVSDTIKLGDDARLQIETDVGAKTIKLPPFTCIGATTLIGEINKPLKDRFPITIELQKYTRQELITSFKHNGKEPSKFSEYIGQEKAKEIIIKCFKSLSNENEIEFNEDAINAVIDISFGVMRLKKVYAKMAMIFAKADNKQVVDVDSVKVLMNLYDIDANGFGRPHRAIIKALVEKRKNSITGKSYSMSSQSLASIASVTKSDVDTIYTPILEGLGIIDKDGRQMKKISDKGYMDYKNMEIK